MVIRHAEKPDPQAGISGVTQQGIPDKNELTIRGWQRAGALVRLFNPHSGNGPRGGLGVPGAIFAPPPTGDNESKRPLHTVTLLAKDLGLTVDMSFVLHQETDLIAAAVKAADMVLVCWHHERIPKISAALGVEIDAWPDDVFDRVLVFDRDGDGWKSSTLQQHVLPGDL